MNNDTATPTPERWEVTHVVDGKEHRLWRIGSLGVHVAFVYDLGESSEAVAQRIANVPALEASHAALLEKLQAVLDDHEVQHAVMVSSDAQYKLREARAAIERAKEVTA